MDAIPVAQPGAEGVIPAATPPATPDGPAITTEAGHDFITVADLQDSSVSAADRAAAATGTPPAAPGAEPVPAVPAQPTPAAPVTPVPPGQAPVTPPGTGASEGEPPTPIEPRPAPYDQDPKWLAARSAEKRLGEVLTRHGFKDVDALEDALDDGADLQDLLGDRDARQVVQDVDEFVRSGEWEPGTRRTPIPADRQDPLETGLSIDADNDTPEEIAAKQADRITTLEDYIRGDRGARSDYDNSVRAIEGFNQEVENVLVAEGVPETHKELYRIHLGVNNPADDVDTGRRSNIRSMARSGVAALNELISNERQAAVNEYAAGKGKFVPATPGTGTGAGEPAPIVPATPAAPVVPKALTPAETVAAVQGVSDAASKVADVAAVDRAFGDANAEYLEILKTAEGM